ncbi:hypothetical protein J4405_02995 [Candidatus Woesearchaeota archaeon]|nr:hypothetical protein [Candidatus Woesearchaeota archaeon]
MNKRQVYGSNYFKYGSFATAILAGLLFAGTFVKIAYISPSQPANILSLERELVRKLKNSSDELSRRRVTVSLDSLGGLPEYKTGKEQEREDIVNYLVLGLEFVIFTAGLVGMDLNDKSKEHS